MNRAAAALLQAAALLGATGCVRSYFPPPHAEVAHVRMNVAPEAVSVGPLDGGAVVRLLTAASPGTRLRGARLASIRARRCTAGWNAAEVRSFEPGGGVAFGIEIDGVVQVEGPSDVSGAHELKLTFIGREVDRALRSPLLGSSAVDLEIESSDGIDCVRVPLGADAPERTWRPDPGSAGFLFAAGARGFPLSGTTRPAAMPVATFFERLGGASEAGSLYLEPWVGGGASSLAFVGGSVGGDRAIWSRGPWSFRGGLAYDVAFGLRTGAAHGLESVLHGPRVTPALSWSPLWAVPLFPGFPLGRRSTSMELELPVSAWFGAQGAPTFVVVPAVGLSVHVEL